MAIRISKRVYTGSALEFWLSKLSSDWERSFPEEMLARGRRIYRRGEVKEVELGEEDAIVHGKVGDFEGYVVLDWDGPRLKVRSSTGEREVGRVLAVAGMYEVEELVGDEVNPLAPEVDESSLSQSAEGEDPADTSKGSIGTNETNSSEEASEPETESSSRALLLQFSANDKGLIFSVFWRDENSAPQHALGEKASASDEPTNEEREKVIRLMNMARKAGFHFLTREGFYVLEEIERAPGFVRNEIEGWQRYFEIELDEDVRILGQGIREVDVIARADVLDDDSLDLQWDLRLEEGSVLSPDEGRWLMKRGRNTAILPGRGLVRIRDDEADTLMDWHETMSDKPNQNLPKYMLFSLFGQAALKMILTPDLRKWRESLLKPPVNKRKKEGVLSILRPYQRYGVQWLSHLFDGSCHGLLADEMGLGKTLQVLSLIAKRPVADKPSLIVCPASVVPVWLGEIERFYPDFEVRVVKKDHHFGNHEEPFLWLCSYTQLRRHKALLGNTEFGYAILDEAQFIKNPEAKVTIACMHLKADHRLALTGTPLENRFLDVWTLFRFLMPGLLGARRKFEQELQTDPFGTIERVRKQIAPFVLRRTKKEVTKELPDKVQYDLVCPLTDLQRTEYQRLTTDGITRFGEDLKGLTAAQSLNFLSLLTRLRQCCCHPDLLPWADAEWQHSGKITVLMDRLSELMANQHKVVIFSQFVGMLERVEAVIQEQFPETTVYTLTGKTVDRATPVKSFQENENSSIILVSLRAGGTGITLNTADYVFLLDPWWNPAVEDQAIDRVHRIGQKKTVFVYNMITAGTLEARIQKLKADKRDLFDEAVGSLSGNAEFNDYFSSLSELIALLPDNQRNLTQPA